LPLVFPPKQSAHSPGFFVSNRSPRDVHGKKFSLPNENEVESLVSLWFRGGWRPLVLAAPPKLVPRPSVDVFLFFTSSLRQPLNLGTLTCSLSEGFFPSFSKLVLSP